MTDRQTSTAQRLAGDCALLRDDERPPRRLPTPARRAPPPQTRSTLLKVAPALTLNNSNTHQMTDIVFDMFSNQFPSTKWEDR